MIAPVFLLAFVVLVAAGVPRLLVGAAWVTRSPHVAVVVWQAATTAALLGLLLAGVTLALPVLPVESQLMQLVRASHLDVADHYLTPAGHLFAALALAATLYVVLRVCLAIGAQVLRARSTRSRQRESLALVGTRHPDGYTVLDHAAPLVYCLPGRGGTVVVTAAALTSLTPLELTSVLAHERRHLAGRHDLPLVMTAALADVFGRVPFFRTAHAEVAALLEMRADDAVCGGDRRRAMATALVALAGPAQVSPVSDRVRRLLSSAGRATASQRVSAGALAISLLAAPVGLALAPALEAAATDCCHLAQPYDPTESGSRAPVSPDGSSSGG